MRLTPAPRQRERLQAVLEDLCSQPHSPERERLIRVVRAVFAEIRVLEDRLRILDPEGAAVPLRPLAEVERDQILSALRRLGTVAAASQALGISPATIYRKLAEYGVRSAPRTLAMKTAASLG